MQRLMKATGKYDTVSGASGLSGVGPQAIERRLSGEDLQGRMDFTPSQGGNTAMNSEAENLRLSFADAQKVAATQGQLSETNPVSSDRALSYHQ